MSSLLHKWYRQEAHIAPLATFRILLGILMMVGTARFVALGWIEDHYTDPVFHFKYFGFSWVKAGTVTWMYVIHACLFGSALLFTFGWYYRWAALVMFFTFTYTELIDLSYYLNHYYFVSLVCFLMIWLPAHRYLSIDSKRNPHIRLNYIPSWVLNLLRTQIAIVYIYAGLAKINHAWLIEAMPLRLWLPAKSDIPLIGSLFQYDWMAYVFSWGGMLYDCTIVFFLLIPKTRIWAFGVVVLFHLMTGILFQIGVFPLVMIVGSLLFFSANWHRKVQGCTIGQIDTMHKDEINNDNKVCWQPPWSKRWIGLLVGMYLLFQMCFPWRYLLYSGNIFWTEEGYRFSWRVMLMEKSGIATFYIKDGPYGKEGMVFNGDFLNLHQEKQMAMQADMILQYAHFLGEYYKGQGYHDPEVRAEVYVTLNGKPSQLLFDSSLNLLSLEDGWEQKSWLYPCPE